MKKSFSYNSIISTVNYIVSSLFAIAYSIFLSRSVGSDGLGNINLVLLSLSLCNIIFNLGIGQSLVFFYSKRENIVLESLIITIFISLISILLFLFFDNLLFSFFHTIPANWVYMIIFISPFIHLKNLAEYYYAAINKFIYNSGLNLIDIILRITVSFFFIFLFNPLDGFFYSIIFVGAFVGLVPWLFIINKIKSDLFNRNIRFCTEGFVSIFSYGFPSYISVLVAFLSLRIDQFFISYFLDSSDLGIYVIAVIFAELPFKLSNAISKVLFANITSKEKYSPNLTAKLLRIILLISFFVVIFIYLFANYFIVTFYGKSFLEVYDILLFLLPGSFFFNISQILNSDMAGRGYPSYGMRIGLVVLILSVLLNIFLIPIFGLKGVAIVSSLTYIIAAVSILFYFFKTTPISMEQLFKFKKTDFNFKFD